MDGEKRVLATAQYIVKSLGTNETDMIEILSQFDTRFSDLLTNNKGHGSSELQDGLDAGMDAAEEVIVRWDKGSLESMVWDSEEEAAGYLHAVDEVQSILDSLSLSGSEVAGVDRAKQLLQRSMARLEEEFRYLLDTHSAPLEREWLLERSSSAMAAASSVNSGRGDGEESSHRSFEEATYSSDEDEDVPVAQPVTDINPPIDLLPDEVIKDLHDIAKRMVQAGYKRECCQVYSTVRKVVVEESLRKLGMEKLTSEEINRMAWEVLQVKIRRWIQVMDVGVKVLFASEKQLCDQVFEDIHGVEEACFADFARGSMMQLLNFGEVVASSRRSTDKLIALLDMYEKLREVLPEINFIFSGEACLTVREEASGVLMRLGEAARGTFAEFENAIHRDPPNHPVPGGALHPLTRYVMNYLRLLLVYVDTLKQLFGETPDAPLVPGEVNGHGNHAYNRDAVTEQETSPLAVQFIWLIHVLESNLDNKAKLYRDLALSNLFLLNNTHYILQKVRGSEIGQLLGSDWIRKQTWQVRQHATNYKRSAWARVMAFLKDEGIRSTGGFSSGVSKAVLKDRFKSFNAAFEEIHKTQSSWCVPNPQLCTDVKIAIEETLVPAYRAFLGRYRIYLDSERQPSRYIKYTPEELEAKIGDLFQGTA